MKKSRIIALLTAIVMIMSVVPVMAETRTTDSGYFVDADGNVYEKSGANLIENPGFEDGLSGLTDNAEYYEVSNEDSHSGTYSLKALKSTKGDGAITKYFAVADAEESYYLSFWYKNVDSVARRPRVTFAFTDSSKTIPTEEDDFTDATNAWIQAGTASNDQDMEYSRGEWVQYSTVLRGNGNADACKYVVLNIYGLTKDVTFVDDFELYELTPSEEYNDAFAQAIAEWKSNSMPSSILEGFGTLSLPRKVSVSSIGVEWSSTSVAINAQTGEYSAQPEEELVILRARLYAKNNTSIFYDFEYPFIVKSMFTPYINWMKSEVFASLGTAIDGDLNLITSHEIAGYYPATITWECSDSAVLDGEGHFTAPETTEYVDLIATIECNGSTTSLTKRMKAIGGNIVADGLVMYYDFEKALGKSGLIYDNSQNDAVYNATSEGVTIVDGYAKFATGGATIVLPTNYGSALPGSYSVSMWVNLDKSLATNTAMYRFFDFGGGAYTSQFLRYIPATGQLSFMDRGTSGGSDTWAINTVFTGMAQTWKLLTFTYEKGTTSSVATVYIDGEEIATSGANTTLTNSISAIATSYSTTGYIGRTQWNNTDNPDFVGLMDDIRIYNRAITEDEILTLYNETRPTVTAPVTIKFQDVDGETLKDDVTISVDVDTTYDVPTSYKSLPSFSDENYRYIYKYISSKSTDSITVSADGENVCILVFQLDKQAKGNNLIENGSFVDGTTGWTNRLGTDITGATVEYDSSIGANVMKIATEGKASTQNIGTVWNVETGKDYTISFDIYTGTVLTASNYQYNRLSDAFTIGDVNQRENSGNDIIPWGEGLTAGSWTHFEKDFTAVTDILYFQSSWGAGEMKFANFVLAEAGTDSGEDDNDDKFEVTIKYVDAEGNTIREDEIVKVAKGVNTYTVPDSYKTVEGKTQGSVLYKYNYNATETAGRDVVSLSILKDNVATLVFDMLKFDTNGKSIMENGSFEDASGNFSLSTWLSCETGKEFGSPYSTNHGYAVAADKYIGDKGAEYSAENEIPDGNWAFGSKWNDGLTGLCSLANFVPVEEGKSYLVSYDYKHKTAGTSGKYISTSFVTSKNISSGQSEDSNIPQDVTTEWQTNTFVITAPSNGYIYFHFSYIGSGNGPSGGNDGSGPFWYFDNFKVIEAITFENEITYSLGYAEIVAEDGTEGYLIQASYNNEGALTGVVISEKLTLSREEVTKVPVAAGSKLILVKDLTSLEPIAPAIIAE